MITFGFFQLIVLTVDALACVILNPDCSMSYFKSLLIQQQTPDKHEHTGAFSS